MLFVELEFAEPLLASAPAPLVTEDDRVGGATLLLLCGSAAALCGAATVAAATLSPLCGKVLPLGG